MFFNIGRKLVYDDSESNTRPRPYLHAALYMRRPVLLLGILRGVQDFTWDIPKHGSPGVAKKNHY